MERCQIHNCEKLYVEGSYKCNLCHAPTAEFIDNSQTLYGSSYYYQKSWVNNDDPITITCKKHGDFQQTKAVHFRRASGCELCKTDATKKFAAGFLLHARKKHGMIYDYPSLEEFSRIIEVVCPCGKRSYIQTERHLAGEGCKSCSYTDLERLVKKSRSKYGDAYDYSRTDYNAGDDQIYLVCVNHGSGFIQSVDEHLNGVLGCIGCIIDNLSY